MSRSIANAAPVAELRRWMADRHLGALYLTNPVSIAYLTGFFADPHERLMALAIRRDGATLIVPALEAQKAEANAENVKVVSWRDGEDAYALVDALLSGTCDVGVEKQHITLHAAEVITSRAGISELADVGPEIRRLRLLKSPDEIEKIARAAAITDAAGEAVFARMRAGQTEIEVGHMLAAAIGERGARLAFPSLAQSGPNSAMPHIEASDRKLAQGDFVLLDFGAMLDGYRADTTRMAVIGEPSARHREIHDLVLRAHDAAVAAVRAGATTGDIDAAARRVIDDAGYGDRFFHRIGHGIGLEAHEDPSLDPGSERVLEPGMVFTIEPGVYIPGFGGVRIEDDVAVEEDGCRVLTQEDRSLRVIK